MPRNSEEVRKHAVGIPVPFPITVKLTMTDGSGAEHTRTLKLSEQHTGDTSPREDEIAYAVANEFKLVYRHLVSEKMGSPRLTGDIGRQWRATLSGGKAGFIFALGAFDTEHDGLEPQLAD